METKEAILATISEFSKANIEKENNILNPNNIENEELEDNKVKDSTNIFIDIKEDNTITSNDVKIDDEIILLLKLKEKSLVLFAGLKSSKNLNIEKKLEIVINYLEYQLYAIEDRLKTLKEEKAKGS